jgi:hypothetical protein
VRRVSGLLNELVGVNLTSSPLPRSSNWPIFGRRSCTAPRSGLVSSHLRSVPGDFGRSLAGASRAVRLTRVPQADPLAGRRGEYLTGAAGQRHREMNGPLWWDTHA